MNNKLPKVAIIGKTNVGKSALFNRLMKNKQAIVAKEEGTTRDNVIGKVNFNDQSFWLIDTAGLKDPEDQFESTIQEQIDEASEIADLIIVVVDSTKYVDNEDILVAKKALKSRKHTILSLNKVDLKSSVPDNEFNRLGIKTKIHTSAEHNTGIENLLNTIVNNIPKIQDRNNLSKVTVSLIGRPNVGKSTLFNRLAAKQQAIVSDRAGTTRDPNKLIIKYHNQNIELIDTAGIRKQGKQEVGIEKFSVLRTISAIEDSDVCLLLIDSNELNVSLDQKLAGIIKDAGKGLIIVVSKWDNVENKNPFLRDQIAKQISDNFDFASWAPLIFTSSLTGQNVTKIFDLVLEIHLNRTQEVKTSLLNQILQNAVISHTPAGLKNTKPKLKYIVQTDNNPPWFVIYGSNLKLTHWSYTRFLERKIREKINFIGTPIKISYRDESNNKINGSNK